MARLIVHDTESNGVVAPDGDEMDVDEGNRVENGADAAAPAANGVVNGRRTSGRQRKAVKRLVDEGVKSNRGGDADEEEEDHDDEGSAHEAEPSDEDDEESFKVVPAKRRKTSGDKRTTAAPRKRARKAVTDDEGPRVQAEYNIAADNSLFNAVRTPRTALQTAVDDWIVSYQDQDADDTGPGVALAELVNFILRCCGCSNSVDRYEAQDLEAATQRLDEIQDEFTKIGARAYPLIAKKQSATFRKRMGDFIARLIDATHTSEILYDDTFCESLQTWLVAATSSRLRSFRHTATAIALELVAALCSNAAAVSKSFAAATRQRDAETKKAGSADKHKLRSLDERVKETHERKVKLEEYLQELFDGVWIHRYRDAEPVIRSESIRALSVWMKAYPEFFLKGDYLRYIGWILTDPSKDARHDAVKAMQALYAMDDYVGTMQHFTERFKGRLIEMGESEIDVGVRCTAIETLRAIDKHGLLEDDQRDSLARLIFSAELRVRLAVAPFFSELVDEDVTERKGDRDIDESTATQIELKSLAILLDRHGAYLDGESDDDTLPVTDLLCGASNVKGRIDAAVKVLSDQLDSLQDVQGLIDYLLVERNSLDDAVQLDDTEETVLLSVLVAVARQTALWTKKMGKKTDGSEDDARADLTRALVKALPRLFDRYQADASKVADVLSLVPVLDLDLYLELRMVTAYEALWDDVAKQFSSQSASETLDAAQSALQSLLGTSALGKTNEAKVAALEQSLVASLREATAGKELESVALDETERDALSAKLGQIARLASVHDIVEALQDTGGLRFTSAWTVVDALSDRGRLGDETEDSLVDSTLKILFFYTIWLARTVRTLESAAIAEFIETRATLVTKLSDLAFGEQSNATEATRRSAFARLLQLFIIFSSAGRLGPLALDCPEEMQYRCADFIQAEIERYAEESTPAPVDGDASDDEDAPRKGAKPIKLLKPKSLKDMTVAHSFAALVTEFAKAVRVDIVALPHAAVLLAHVDRFAQPFDDCVRLLGEAVREAALDPQESYVAATVAIESLREAHSLHVSGTISTDDQLMALARQLGSAIVERGKKFSIAARISSTGLIRIHSVLGVEAINSTIATEDEDERKRILSMFKALGVMLTGITGREALDIQTKLKSALDQAESTTGKTWEAQRVYAKRLATAMSKDASIKQAAQRRIEEDGEMLPPPVPKRAKPTPAVRHNPRPSRHQQPEEPESQTSEEQVAAVLDPSKSPESKRKRDLEDVDGSETGGDVGSEVGRDLGSEMGGDEDEEEDEVANALKVSKASINDASSVPRVSRQRTE